MPLLETKGAGSAQGFGLSLGSAEAVYIEDVFSTYLYAGNSSTQTITNGIDLAGEGGLVWVKSRSNGGARHHLTDTVRGATNSLKSDDTAANEVISTGLTSFLASGFSLGANGNFNFSGDTYASWTFRKQPKFFDVVTYTGNGSNRTIAHDLGSVPGCIIVKVTNTSDNWQVYHRANTNAPATDYLVLNLTNATADDDTRWNDTLPTSTTFSLGTSSAVNGSGNTYVAYLFAHDAGGFGLEGTDNVISCGSYVSTDGSPITVTLGYEPQWILVKSTGNSSTSWNMFDVMRGWPVTNSGQQLQANKSDAETSESAFTPTATGFVVRAGSNPQYNEAGAYRYIYIAIRRGPMKVPTSGTSVFSPLVRTGTASSTAVTSFGFPIDLVTSLFRPYSEDVWFDRLRGASQQLATTTTAAEVTQSASINGFDLMNGYRVGIDNVTNMTNGNTTTSGYLNYGFRRAPGFFDVVCYTGTGTARTVAHNLAAVPELMIVRRRDNIGNWIVYHSLLGNTYYQNLNYDFSTSGPDTDVWSSTTPSASSFSVGNFNFTNASGSTFVAYLFATLAGVSKVGSYTGTGTTLQINCGFTGGARFVMIKRTDSTGGWYVWDSARGIVAGNDPYLLLNSTAAEVTSTDYVDTYSLGFEISSTAPAAINASGGSYIFLAIA